MENLTLAASIVIAVCAYIFDKERDRVNLRRELRTRYLLTSYHDLEKISNRERTQEFDRLLEDNIAKVQLLGTKEQVDLARKFAFELADQDQDGACLDPLLDKLRADLRDELRLGPCGTRVIMRR